MKQYCEATTLLDQNRTKVLSLFLQVEPHSPLPYPSRYLCLNMFIREGCQKKRKKCDLLPNPTQTQKKFTHNFF